MSLSLRLDGGVASFDVLILDCDGVIFDSNRLKTEAFRAVLREYPSAAVEAFIAYHQRFGGVSRYVKLEHFFTTLHPVARREEALQRALDGFALTVQEGYAALRPRPEAIQLAEAAGADATYVISGSDQEELREVFAGHGIQDRFRGILGSPQPKLEHARAVVRAQAVEPDRVLFVGDGHSDAAVAQELGFHFGFLREMAEWPQADEVLRGRSGVTVFPRWDDILGAIR